MKILFAIFLILLITFFNLPNSYACSCTAPIDYFQALSYAEYVFTGKVTQIENSDGPQKVHFEVSSMAKGNITNGVFILENNNIIRHGEFTTNSSCDVGYEVGVTYNVFVYDNINMNNEMCTTKAVGALGILNPIEYNLFYYVILSTFGVGIAVFAVWKKRK